MLPGLIKGYAGRVRVLSALRNAEAATTRVTAKLEMTLSRFHSLLLTHLSLPNLTAVIILDEERWPTTSNFKTSLITEVMEEMFQTLALGRQGCCEPACPLWSVFS